MVLFAFAAFVLGYEAVPGLASRLLARRGSSQNMDAGAIRQAAAAALPLHRACASSGTKRLLLGLGLAGMAVSSWSLLGPAQALLATFGFALMEAALVCDLRARIIPWELSLGSLACALPFRLLAGPPSELIASVLLALALVTALSLCNIANRQLKDSDAIGGGDLRIIPALCIFGGMEGSLVGMFACAALMGSCALVLLIMHWATPRSGIPMAPGLVLWFVLGVFSCMVP